MKFLKKNWGTTKPSVGYGVDWSDPISKGLVGCWLFNEGGGSIAYDIAKKNKGTLTNMAFPATATSGWGSEKFGKTLNFDGTNDYVNIGNQLIADSQTFTMSTWIKTSLTSRVSIFAQDISVSAKKFQIAVSSTGNLVLTHVNSGGTYIDSSTSNTPVPTNTWTHIVAVYNFSGLVKQGYVNGVLQTLSSPTLSAPPSGVTNAYIGKDRNGLMSGSLDDVRIYNRALSATEAKRLYSEPFAGILSPVKRRINSISAGSSLIKTINGLPWASVSTRNGLSTSSIKTINGLAAQ